jgi:hypothetical protein
MAWNNPFQPMGKTYKANATTTSQTMQILANGPCSQVMISSHENTAGTGKAVYLAFGNSTITVTAPTNGTAQNCIVIPPNTSKAYTIPNGFTNDANTSIYVAFIVESSTGECYITPGEGI